MSALAYQRTNAWLQEKGWHTWRWETWNQWSHTRQDGYGFIDLTAIRHDFKGVWGINATDEHVQDHVSKYLDGWDHPKKGRQPANPHLPVWLCGGNRFSIFSWGKRGGRGERKVWTLRLVEFYLDGAQVKTKEVLPEVLEVP